MLDDETRDESGVDDTTPDDSVLDGEDSPADVPDSVVSVVILVLGDSVVVMDIVEEASVFVLSAAFESSVFSAPHPDNTNNIPNTMTDSTARTDFPLFIPTSLIPYISLILINFVLYFKSSFHAGTYSDIFDTRK